MDQEQNENMETKLTNISTKYSFEVLFNLQDALKYTDYRYRLFFRKYLYKRYSFCRIEISLKCVCF